MNKRGWQIARTVCVVVVAAAKASAAPDEFQQAIAGDEPVLWYRFDETSGPAVNYGSFSVDYNADYLGTPNRGSPTQAGDRAVRFDSADDFLQSDAVAPGSLAGNPTFSAEALYYVVPDGTASLWAPLLHWGDSTGDPTMKSVYFSFQNGNVTRLYAGFYNGGLRTVADVPRGQWHHVVWVRQGGVAANTGTTLYVDGASVALENDPNLPSDTGTPDVVNTVFRVNRAQDLTRFFTGSIDELALYDKALTAQQVAAHYAAFTGSPCPEDKCIDYDGGCKSCGRPLGTGDKPNASDALFVLKKAVGSKGCNLCICDVDGSGSVVATDALATLRIAVGQSIELKCPPAS